MSKTKVFVLVLSFVSILSSYSLASELKVDSKITQVTIYPGNALVTRSAEVKLSAGDYKVIFTDIIPNIDENSLKVKGEGAAQVKIMGAQVVKEFLEENPAEKVKQIQDEIQKLADNNKKLTNNQKIIAEEKQYLDSIRFFSGTQIPKDLATKMPTAADLDGTLKFMDSRLRENYDQAIEVEFAIRDNQRKIEVLQRQLAQVSGPSHKLKRSIAVDLEVLKSGSYSLDVSYLVGASSWQPIYDARADFEKSEVELVFQAIIQQKTGEDWEDAQILLSTARADVGGRMPYIAPWIIQQYEPHRGLSLEKSDAARSIRESGVQYMAYSDKENAGMSPKEELPDSIAQEKGVAVVYQLTKKASIKSDGSQHKLPVSSLILKAGFKYSTYPKVAPCAYLGSRVTNAKELQLLAGRVNVFLDGDFVGSSSIDNIGPGEEFDLFLGVDDNVKVKRQLLEKKVDDVLLAGIPSPNKKISYKYKITLENYKNKKSSIYLYDAIPVSQNDRIKVKVEKVSLEPNKKDWEDRKGIWRWELGLEPKAKQEIFLTYSVEFPRDMRLENLD